MFFLASAVIFALVLVSYRFFLHVADRSPEQTQSQSLAFWATVPIVGVSRDRLFPWILGAVRSVTQCYTDSFLGYEAYGKTAETVFAQPMMGIGAVVNIPVSQLHVLNKSESEIITKKAQVEGLQPSYTTGDQEIFDELIHFDVVRRFFRKSMIDMFIGPVNEELDSAFRKHWDTNTADWKTVNVWDTCTKIMSQVASRIIFGAELACNDEFTDHARKFGRGLFGGAAFINALPSLIRPALAPILGHSARRHEAACLKIIVPYLERRLQQQSDEYRDDKDKPNDPVQWLVDECMKAGGKHVNIVSMARRLLQLHLTSNFGITYAFVGSVLDLHGSESRDEFLEGLRAEHRLVVGKHGNGISTSAELDHLYRLDSAIRESMRVSTFPIISFMRIVSPNTDGLSLDDGTRIPPGTRIGVPSRAIHRDPDLYPSPSEYDAFRFSRPFEAQHDDSSNSLYPTVSSREAISAVTDSFLAFGYGKHACPGRWFAAQYLKQALAHVISNYDVEGVGKPWAKTVMFNMVLPPTEVTVRIRRRSRH
ncbi:cytochrome P450 [Hypoxylon argillaceum]|nr:cytochrome P450 [Hypoxylon argillaceum]